MNLRTKYGNSTNEITSCFIQLDTTYECPHTSGSKDKRLLKCTHTMYYLNINLIAVINDRKRYEMQNSFGYNEESLWLVELIFTHLPNIYILILRMRSE